MAFTLPLSKVAKSLAPSCPTSSLLGPHTISSALGILAINFSFVAVPCNFRFMYYADLIKNYITIKPALDITLFLEAMDSVNSFVDYELSVTQIFWVWEMVGPIGISTSERYFLSELVPSKLPQLI